MVEYKKRRVQLQSGGYKYQYYKQYKNGKEKKIEKEEYYKNKKGGTNVQQNCSRNSLSRNINDSVCFFSGNLIKEHQTFPYGSDKRLVKFFMNNNGDISFLYGPNENDLTEYTYIGHNRLEGRSNRGQLLPIKLQIEYIDNNGKKNILIFRESPENKKIEEPNKHSLKNLYDSLNIAFEKKNQLLYKIKTEQEQLKIKQNIENKKRRQSENFCRRNPQICNEEHY